MDETAVGVVADAAGAQRQGGAVQAGQAVAGDVEIGGHALDVVAVLGDAVAPVALHQPIVRLLGAVARNDVERLVGADLALQGIEGVDQVGVDAVDRPGAVIAEQLVDGAQGVRQIAALDPVFGVQTLAGMLVEKR